LVVDGQLVVDPHLTDGRHGSFADRLLRTRASPPLQGPRGSA
jgi:hypothetical protein